MERTKKLYELLGGEDDILCLFNVENRKELFSKVLPDFLERDSLGQCSKEEIVELILEREEMATTGIGDGLAIPHAIVKGLIQPFLRLVVLCPGIEYESKDNQPCGIFCFILSPDARSNIVLLAKVSKVFKNGFASELLTVNSPEKVFSLLKKREDQ